MWHRCILENHAFLSCLDLYVAQMHFRESCFPFMFMFAIVVKLLTYIFDDWFDSDIYMTTTSWPIFTEAFLTFKTAFMWTSTAHLSSSLRTTYRLLATKDAYIDRPEK